MENQKPETVQIDRDLVRGFVDRIDQVFAEIDALRERKRGIYNEADLAGIDKDALVKVVGVRRSRAKNIANPDERDAIVRLYLDLLDGKLDAISPRARERERARQRENDARQRLFQKLRDDPLPAKNGRSKSVYFIHAEEAALIKIGVSDNVEKRIATLSVGSPLPLRLLLTLPGDHKTEAELHARFAANRVMGEWFSTEDGKVMQFIAEAKSPQVAA